MRKYGLKTKNRTWKLHKRVYNLEETFLDNINIKNAWVLGWLASDGYVRKLGNSFSFGIKVARRDEDVL
jgi:hypothetical protein